MSVPALTDPPAPSPGARRMAMAAALVMALCAWAPGSAQTAGSADPAQALARAQQLLRQVAQQKVQLETENARLKAEAAGLKKKLERAEAQAETLAADLAASRRDNERTGARLERTGARLEKTEAALREAIDRYRDTAATLRETEAARRQLESELAATRAELEDAENKNIALYQANVELLDHYHDKGAWDAILQAEPFTGLKQVQIENVLEEYRYKLDQLRYERPKAQR